MSPAVTAYILTMLGLQVLALLATLLTQPGEIRKPPTLVVLRATRIVSLALIAWGLLALHTPAHALTFGAHLHTAHLGAQAGQMQDSTPGLYLRTDAGLTLGHYRNSHGRPSSYAAWTWQTADQRFALTAGVVTGYPARRYSPLLVPSVRFALTDSLAARIAYIPKPPRYGSAAGVHFAIETEF